MDRPADSAVADVAALGQRLAELAAQVLQELPQRLHPAWVASIGVAPALLSSGGPGVLNAALQSRFDLCWPDLSAASRSLELAWLLPPAELRRVCAARALFPLRNMLARTLEAGLRRGARALVGSDAFDALVRAPAPRRDVAAPSPFVPDEIVLAGWELLRRDSPWADARSCRLVELMLPPVHPWAGGAAHDDAAERDAFETELQNLFPEHAWLFGSEPASLTSA